MSKVNPEPNIIHIMGCYVLGNPNGEKVRASWECLVSSTKPNSHTVKSKPSSPAGWEHAAILSHERL